MTANDEARLTQVVSRDGTEIGVWTSGAGPPLLLVHGAPADHTRFDPLLPFLVPHATVHAMDRRGRGASGDSPAYRLEREFEDVAAVVDAVAGLAGAPVAVYGHSFGGICAFGGASLSGNVHRLVLYEGWPTTDPEAYALPSADVARMDALLAEGDRDGVVATLFRDVVGMSDEEIDALRAMPAWRARVAAAPTLTRELGALAAPLDASLAATIAAPTLLVTGADSSDPAALDVDTVAAALPDARIEVLEGQGHVGDVLDPERFAALLLGFLDES